MDDARWMRQALELAERGWGRVAPNPMVGAVVVRGTEVVGEGFHPEFGGDHAEVVALKAAGERAWGATLYVTLEPCAHQGKTPPCATAVLRSGVARVVVGAADPNPQAAGGAERLRKAGIEVVTGVGERAVRDLDPAFFFLHGDATRPWTALKLALSLDARVADASGRSAWITSAPARAEVHRLRAGFDAVGVGSGTALADDPLLTARGEQRPRIPPLRVVFDRRLRLPLDSRLVRSAGDAPVRVVCRPDAARERRVALEERGVEISVADDLRAGLEELRKAGTRSLLVEGGARLTATLLAAELVDRLYLFYAPLVLGNGALNPFAGTPVALGDAHRWRHLRSAAFGPDTLIVLDRT
jgi:diaminohydroxyphosphoribosylaminopyrimidine deaminase/5-amino-6-(5-phosphoribosylamino)uracil reductase